MWSEEFVDPGFRESKSLHEFPEEVASETPQELLGCHNDGWRVWEFSGPAQLGCGDPTGINTCRVDGLACACVHSGDDDFRWYGDTQYVVGHNWTHVLCSSKGDTLRCWTDFSRDVLYRYAWHSGLCLLPCSEFLKWRIKHNFILKWIKSDSSRSTLVKITVII